MKKSFNIQEFFAPQVQMSWNQAHDALFLVKSFGKTPRTCSEASSSFSGSHNYKTKTKQTTFLHRYRYSPRIYLPQVPTTWVLE